MRSRFIKNVKDNYFFVIIFLAGCCISLLSSVNPFSQLTYETDSSVFTYIARSMHTQGAIPYKDLFDHKGPLMYLINFIGYPLSTTFLGRSIRGIWIVEFFLIQFNLIMVYFITRKATKDIEISVATSLLFAILFGIFFDWGNLTEEYAIPFILVSLYFFTEYFLELDYLPKFKVAVIGFCFGCVMMLRPNMISIWIVFCISLIIYFIISKKFNDIVNSIIFFLIGAVIAVLPFIIYYIANNALNDFIYSYWKFNLIYVDNKLTDLSNVINSLNFFIYPSIIAATILYIVKAIEHYNDKKKFLFYVALLANCILTMYFVVMPTNNYTHYGMFSVPCVIIGIAEILKNIVGSIASNRSTKLIKNKHLKLLFLVSLVVVASFTNLLNLYETAKTANMKTSIQKESYYKYVLENTEEDDEILVIGNLCAIYLETDRYTSSKYFYQTPIADVDDSIKDKVIDELYLEKSDLILVSKDDNDGNFTIEVIKVLDEMVKNNRYSKQDNLLTNITVYKKK